ncbi:MAG: AmmeMemoRadiSam system protein B [Bacteroidales bacterium]|nr:AmmeMemoRadiSam system protein B [Bacteroidales bacterium]
MKRYNSFFVSLFIAMLFAFCSSPAQQPAAQVNRLPAFAGTFYPAGKSALEAELQKLFKAAKPVAIEGKVQTLIVPHAGYAYSGEVAASGYKTIPADAQYKNIFLITSSHREQFNGVSVYSPGNYITPLGEVQVNREIATTLINGHQNIFYYEKAHNREHSIEVQIPFIQYHFQEVPPIVPLVMGSSLLANARELAAALLPYFTPDNLFIISSDFSHYPSYKDAIRVDQTTGEAILTKDPKKFYNVLKRHSNGSVNNLSTPCCGWSSIITMLYMADRREEMVLSPIIYRNSGDSKAGDKERVVGYWAIAGHEISLEELPFTLNKEEKEALLSISRTTLESYITTGKLKEIPHGTVTSALRKPAGAFVSLYMGGRLRGCIGNFSPSEPLYAVVQEMTIAAATQDKRFAPVESTELEYIKIEISVLTPLQKISSIDEFQLGRHGIYMTKNGRSGTYLPQVAEQTGWSAEDLLGHCAREKAGIGWEGWKEADLYVYEAIIFGEDKKK